MLMLIPLRNCHNLEIDIVRVLCIQYTYLWPLPDGLRLIDVMLDHVFFLSTCKYGIVQEDCFLCCGKQVEVSSPPAPPFCFRKHTFTQARQLGPEVCLVCSLLSHKFGEGDGLVNKLVFVVSTGINGIMPFALNSGESQTDGSCLKSPKRNTEIVPNGLSL